tara:strand:- start:1012 stop:1203 length:192 start_codon:yes stop_codon:yes gene_type:complete
MCRSNLSIIFLFIIFCSCENRVSIENLEIINDKSYYNGEEYSGFAIKKMKMKILELKKSTMME